MARREVSFGTLKGGVIIALLNREFQKVLKNIADNNTAAEITRKMTLTISIKPNKERGFGAVKMEVGSTLAKPQPEEAHIYMGSDGDKVRATEDYAEQQELQYEEQENITQFNKEGAV